MFFLIALVAFLTEKAKEPEGPWANEPSFSPATFGGLGLLRGHGTLGNQMIKWCRISSVHSPLAPSKSALF